MLGPGPLRSTLLTLVASALLYGGACASDSADPTPGAEAPDLAGVVYVGATNDEGLAVLLAARASTEAAPRVTAPEAGAVLDGPVAFTFTPPTTARLEPAPATARPPSFSPAELFGPPRLARAHGEPMNGEAFLLTFSSADEPNVLRVFTDLYVYEPTEEQWALLAAAGELLLTVRMGVFEEGRLPSGSGPFVSAPLHFSITGS